MEKNNNNEIIFPALLTIGALLIWFVFPQLFMVPFYELRYLQLQAMSYVPLFNMDTQAKTVISYMDQVSPYDKGAKMWIVNIYENRIFYVWDVLLGLTIFGIAYRYKKRMAMLSPHGGQVNIEWLIEGLSKKDFPHLRPFVNFSPLDMPEKSGIWRMPDTMIDYLGTHDLMPLCKNCKMPIYAWEGGIADCESHHEKRNILQGLKERYCRLKKDKDQVTYFREDRAKSLFFKQVVSMGEMPKDVADLPDILWNTHPFAYMILALCLSRLEAPGFVEQKDTDKIVGMMADMVKGFKEGSGLGVYDKQACLLAKKHVAHYMTKEIIEKYDEPLNRHGYIITYLMGIFDYTHLEKGVLPSSLFAYLRGFDRPLFIALNVIGSPSPFIEAWGSFYHYKAEQAVDRPIIKKEATLLSVRYTQKFRSALGIDPE